MKPLRHCLSMRFPTALSGLSLFITVIVISLVAMLNLQQATANDSATQADVTTRITYQGQLNDANSPANGKYDFQFTLFDVQENGTRIDDPVAVPGVEVKDGVFTVELNFGFRAFTGKQLWLAIEVRKVGDPTFAALAPRQPINAVPYAIRARSAVSADSADSAGSAASVPWSGITGIPDGFKDGVDNVGAGGDGITGVTAGAGLSGGGTSGNVSLSLNFGAEGTVAGNGFKVNSDANSGNSYGLAGTSKSPSGYGVYGRNNTNIILFTEADYAWGVYGDSGAIGGIGVQGVASNKLVGGTAGVYGEVTSTFGSGIIGINNYATPVPADGSVGYAIGIRGESKAPGGRGVQGLVSSSSGNTIGVAGFVNSADGYGVYGRNNAVNGVGVQGYVSPTVGVNYGVAGYTNSKSGAGIYAYNYQKGLAALLDGNVKVNGNLDVTGTLTKKVNNFKIDHPLDPENKYLYHSVIESSEMMNLYNGNVSLGNNGEATVQMPDWFEALNREFRYQLTAIGAPGPNLYIAQEITNNQFKIAGGSPGMKVSWQVTGVRHDPYAQAHPLIVEEDKPPGERGTYLSPVEYGQAETRSLDYHTQQPQQAQSLRENLDILQDIRASQVITSGQ